MLTPSESSYRDDFSLHVGVLTSLILHALFLLVLSDIKTVQPPQPMEVIDVSIEAPKTPTTVEKKNQMVSPSDKTAENLPPPDTNRLSDTDSTVIKEQIKRGAPDAGPVIGKRERSPTAQQITKSINQERSESQPVKSSQQEKSSTKEKAKKIEEGISPKEPPKLSDLKLDSNTLLNDFALKTPKGSPKPFSRPQGSGAMFVGMSGSSDYLPDLPDGDITLLNAKANQFAVFVRRVAIQVFSQIRTMGWQNLSASDIRAIGQDTMVEAVMSPKGELLKVTLEIRSGSGSFDELILKSAQKGARDPNPPEGAKAEDGNVHFIFKSRSWSEISAGRGGLPTERRWLLLETGLE